MNIEPKVKKFAQKIGVIFNNPSLLQQVFVHKSYLNENKVHGLNDNERLEFLGDAVLELIVTANLYKNYPNSEGELTNWRSALVKGQMLSSAAMQIGLEKNLLLSKGEAKSSGKARRLILANAFEALVGAIYLDSGYETAKHFVEKYLLVHLPAILENKSYLDAKTHLQEIAQSKLGITPTYKVMTETGPDHKKEFTVGVYLDNRLIGQGKGSSKQEAQQFAAAQALKENDTSIALG